MPAVSHGYDWVAVGISLRGDVSLTLYVVYLTDSIGMKGVNLTKTQQIMHSLSVVSGPVALIGDFNMPPDELLESGAFFAGSSGHHLQAVVPDVPFTCSQGSGRILDYMLVNQHHCLITPLITNHHPWLRMVNNDCK